MNVHHVASQRLRDDEHTFEFMFFGAVTKAVERTVHTMSLCWSCWSLMMKIMSKRDKMVGMKSMLSSPFVSSQRPNTELAAASTEQREFRVVVMPA